MLCCASQFERVLFDTECKLSLLKSFVYFSDTIFLVDPGEPCILVNLDSVMTLLMIDLSHFEYYYANQR